MHITWVSQLQILKRPSFQSPNLTGHQSHPPLPGKPRSNAHFHVCSDLSVLEHPGSRTHGTIPPDGLDLLSAWKLDTAGVGRTVNRAQSLELRVRIEEDFPRSLRGPSKPWNRPQKWLIFSCDFANFSKER